ncbi:hypothetical protein [Streptomyces sp. NPDC056682]|uniref:hypothetical protein n=1 Tax=Streptomyces sp. NPDC056682 TaxID=3345909 RepID=UPI003689D199
MLVARARTSAPPRTPRPTRAAPRAGPAPHREAVRRAPGSPRDDRVAGRRRCRLSTPEAPLDVG